MVDKDLVDGLVVITVGSCAAEVAAPPRKRGTRAATSSAKAAAAAATRRQLLANRSPIGDVARCIDDALVRPGVAAEEERATAVVGARRRAPRPARSRRLAEPPTGVPVPAGPALRAVLDGTALTGPARDAPTPLGPAVLPSPAPSSVALRALRPTLAASQVPLHGATAPIEATSVVPTLSSAARQVAKVAPRNTKEEVLVPTSRRRPAAATDGRIGRSARPVAAEVRPAAQPALAGARLVPSRRPTRP